MTENGERQTLKACSEDPEDTHSSRLDLDKVLVEEIGQLGRYQLRMVALAVILVVFVSWGAHEYVFTAARIGTRCMISECENTTVQEFSPSWIFAAVPSAGATFDNCHRFAARNTTGDFGNDTCSVAMFDRDTVIPCEEYVYENKDTVVYDFGLACDEWSRSLIGSARTIGTLVGIPITGYTSDRWGRRTALALNGFNMACIGIARYWATTYTSFLACGFFEAVLGSGVFSCAYIILMEIVGPQYRVMVGALTSTAFAGGHCIMGLIAWKVPNWANLTLVLYIPQLFTITYFWLMCESVRWYMSKGRFEKAKRVLENIARVNGKQLSKTSLKYLKQTAKEEKNRISLKEEVNEQEWLVLIVFRHKPILIRCLLSPIWWMTFTFIYYGLSINSVNMSGNKYTNYLNVSAFEIPGFWIAFALLNKVGRKPVLIGGYWICAACQVAYMFIPDGHQEISLMIYLLGKTSISTVVTSLYMYTTELYPTKYRHSLFAFSSMMGRFGSIVAPLTPAFGGNLSFILFAGFALLSGLLVFLTPETLGCKLPETMEEAANIGRKKNTT